MANVTRIVQVVATPEHQGDEIGEVVDHLLAIRLAGERLLQAPCRLFHVPSWLTPRQNIPCARLHAMKMLGKLLDQPMARAADQLRIVRRRDAPPSGGEVG